MGDEEIELVGEIEGGHLSFSKINMFMRCPYQYYLRYVRGIKSIPKLSLYVGTAFHRGQEFGAREMIENRVPSPSEVKDVAIAKYEELIGNGEPVEFSDYDPDFSKPKDDTARMTEICFKEKTSKMKPKEAEASFELSVGELLVRGRIDMIEDDDKKENIVEYKTSTMKPVLTRLFDWQTAIYQKSSRTIKLLKKIYTIRHRSKNRDVTVYEFIKKPESKKTIDDMFDSITKVGEAIKSASLNGYPKACNLEFCNWCGYRKDCRPEIYKTEDAMEKIIDEKMIFTTSEKLKSK